MSDNLEKSDDGIQRKEKSNENAPKPPTLKDLEELRARKEYQNKLRTRQQGAHEIVNWINMSHFRQLFQAQKGDVNVGNFIQIITRILHQHGSHRPEGLDEAELTARLIELHKEIDFDGDGYVKWEEFTTFITDKAMLFNASTSKDILPYRHFKHVDPVTRFRHKNHIEKMCQIRKGGIVAGVEEGSNIITFYNIWRNGSIHATLKTKAPPVALAYVDDGHTLVTANVDLSLRTYNLDEGPLRYRWQERSKCPTSSAQVSLCWAPSHHVLYSGSAEGTTHAWDLETMREKWSAKGHEQIVLDVLSIDHLGVLASASLDTKISIWDTYLSRERLKLTGHNKGVFSLSYNSEYRLLVSGGFDHDVFVWSPFVNTLLCKLPGHTAPLVSVCCVEDSPKIISSDTTGIIKLWDIRNFQCVQTFTTEHEPGDYNDIKGLTSMLHLRCGKDESRLVIGSKRIILFDQDKLSSGECTGDLPISCAMYNKETLTIITTEGRTFKIWDAILGNIKQVVTNAMRADITAMCWDHRKRKIIMGDMQGNVDVFSLHAGALMKSFDKENDTPVLSLVYETSTRSVIAAFIDGVILVYNEAPLQKCEMVLRFDPHFQNVGDLTAMCYSPCSKRLVATASNVVGDAIRLWNYDTAKCESLMAMPSDCNFFILCMIFLDDAPLLAASCSDGYIRVWSALVGSKCLCIMKFPNQQPEEGYSYEGEEEQEYPLLHQDAKAAFSPRAFDDGSTAPSFSLSAEENDPAPTKSRKKGKSGIEKSARQPVPVVCMAWDPNTLVLYTGDEAGRLRKWGFRDLFGEVDSSRLFTRDSAQLKTNSLTPKEVKGRSEKDEVLKKLEGMVPELRWSLDAHEDALITIELTEEPDGLLTGSTDMCAKMWTTCGRPYGKLVQSGEDEQKEVAWNLKVDIAGRERREADLFSHLTEDAQLSQTFKARMLIAQTNKYGKKVKTATVLSTTPTVGGGLDTCRNRTEDLSMSLSDTATTISNSVNYRLLTLLANPEALAEDEMSHGPYGTNTAMGNGAGVDQKKLLQTLRSGSGMKSLVRAPVLGLTKQLTMKDVMAAKNLTLKGGSKKNVLPPLPSTFLDTSHLSTELPPSPGRKESMAPEVQKKLLQLRATLAEMESYKGGDEIFNGRPSKFSEFAKNAQSPPQSEEISVVSGPSMVSFISIKPHANSIISEENSLV